MIIGGGVLGQGNYKPQFVRTTGSRITRASDFTGNADSKMLTIACWFSAGSGTSRYLYKAGSNHIIADDLSGLSGFFYNASGTKILEFEYSVSNDNGYGTYGNGIQIYLISIDLSDIAKRHYYQRINGFWSHDRGSYDLYVNDTIDFTQSSHDFLYDASLPLVGYVGELWLGFGQYIDFSVAENRAKFVKANGYPARLGADGSKPTGTAPTVYLSGGKADFATNRGSGGTLTLAADNLSTFPDGLGTDPTELRLT